MTKKMFLLLTIFTPFLWVSGQTKFESMDKLIEHYSKMEGVVYDVKDDFQLPLPFIERLDRTESLIVEECSEEVVADFVSVDMTSFKDYEVAFRVADEDGEMVTLLLLPMDGADGEKFSELIFVVQEEDEGVLFRLKGVFTEPDPSMINMGK